MMVICARQGMKNAPCTVSRSLTKKAINIILNNLIFSMISHLNIISHHHHLYALLTIPFVQQTMLLPWSYDMMSLVILICCVHKHDYLVAHLFGTEGNKWFLIQIFTLVFTWRYIRVEYLDNHIVWDETQCFQCIEIVSNFVVIWGILFHRRKYRSGNYCLRPKGIQ